MLHAHESSRKLKRESCLQNEQDVCSKKEQKSVGIRKIGSCKEYAPVLQIKFSMHGVFSAESYATGVPLDGGCPGSSE